MERPRTMTHGPNDQDFIRTLIARSISARTGEHLQDIASARWGDRMATIVKAAVGTTGDGFVDYAFSRHEFFAAVDKQTILGRLGGIRRLPTSVRTVTPLAAATAYWIAPGKAGAVARMSLSGATLPPLKVVAIAAVTDETLRDASPSAENLIRTDLSRAVAEAIDQAFLDPTNAGVADATPAAVSNGVTPVPGTGTARTDLKALVADFAGDLTQATFVGHPTTYAGLASSDFPDIGIRGGSLLGGPAIASRNVQAINSPAEFPLFLIDGSGIAVAGSDRDDQVRIITEGDILLDSDPTMSASPPVPAALTSLWQANTVAIMVVRSINWSVVRSGAVAYLTGASYP